MSPRRAPLRRMVVPEPGFWAPADSNRLPAPQHWRRASRALGSSILYSPSHWRGSLLQVRLNVALAYDSHVPVPARCWFAHTWMWYTPLGQPALVQVQLGLGEKGCIRYQPPALVWIQNSYTGFGQVLEPAVNVTGVPTFEDPVAGDTVAAVQPVRVIVLDPYDSQLAVESPGCFAHAWTV